MKRERRSGAIAKTGGRWLRNTLPVAALGGCARIGYDALEDNEDSPLGALVLVGSSGEVDASAAVNSDASSDDPVPANPRDASVGPGALPDASARRFCPTELQRIARRQRRRRELPAVCGDGFVNAAAGELCDDSGQSPTCDPDCSPAVCGDGFVNSDAGELRDDSGQSPTCDPDCSPAVCGDGRTNPDAGEECEPSSDPTCLSDCTHGHFRHLAHRYSFGGTGTVVVDSVGGANGSVEGSGAATSGWWSL